MRSYILSKNHVKIYLINKYAVVEKSGLHNKAVRERSEFFSLLAHFPGWLIGFSTQLVEPKIQTQRERPQCGTHISSRS